jgi:hypothetical protein
MAQAVLGASATEFDMYQFLNTRGLQLANRLFATLPAERDRFIIVLAVIDW